MSFDVADILRKVDLVKVVEDYGGLKLKKNGANYTGKCCFHSEKTASLSVNVSRGIYKCFGCGAVGDAIDFLMRLGKTFQEACTELSSNAIGGEITPEKRESLKKRVDWRQIAPVPSSAPSPSFEHYRLGMPTAYWTYRDATGGVVGYVCRFEYVKETDQETGGITLGKDVLPLCYATDGTRNEWRFMGFNKPRSLYNLDEIVREKDKTVIVVEGEKTAEAVKKLINSAVVTTWLGGSNGVEFADFSPLFGRKVILWQDNDEPGRIAMLGGWRERKDKTREYVRGVLDFIKDKCPVIHGLKIPEDKPNHWDGADEPNWTPVDAREFVLNNSYNLLEEPAAPEPEPEEPPPGGDMPEPEEPVEETLPLRALGYNKTQNGQNEFFVYSFKANQVIRFATSSFSKQSLMQLVDLGWWEHKFYTKSGFNLDMAAQWVMNLCYKAGVYDLDNVRGIGAWVDDGRTVVHAGTHLVESGKTYKLNQFTSRYIYEANRAFGFNIRKPLGSSQSVKIMHLMTKLSWERPVNAYLIAGWCVVAPVCGALYWRPHLWVTGGAGTGKTTVMWIIKNLLGKMAISVQGNTSEAGIRQMLGHNARPVCFDEADSDNQADNVRLQTILSLVRSSSAHDGGLIVKGGQTGSSQSFNIRSCFSFASISPKVTTAADKSRVTIVSLVKSKGGDWDKLKIAIGNLLTDDWTESLQARTISLLPVILKNAETFARAAAVQFGDQRSGDQLGALLAGAYSLYSTKLIEFNEAVTWIRERDWSEIANKDLDESMLFSFIMEQQTTVETDGGSKYERSVGELVLTAARLKGGEKVTEDEANSRLKRIGIKYDPDSRKIIFANRHAWIKKTLEGTNWVGSHAKILQRIEGAVSIESTGFAGGLKSRAVGVPLEYLTGG